MSEGVAHRFPERPRTERGEKSQMPDFDTFEFRAADALRRHQAYLPRLVGRTDDCYVIVYEGLWHML